MSEDQKKKKKDLLEILKTFSDDGQLKIGGRRLSVREIVRELVPKLHRWRDHANDVSI